MAGGQSSSFPAASPSPLLVVVLVRGGQAGAYLSRDATGYLRFAASSAAA